MTTAIRLLKMQATGNDFLIVDGIHGSPPAASLRPEMARRHCNRHLGFGADGFLVLETSGWDFYNSDGSPAAMCGNAARAVGLFLMDSEKTDHVHFQTRIGRVDARREAQASIEVAFTLDRTKIEPLAKFSAHLTDTGVPHAVLRVESLTDQARLREMGTRVKADFSVTGINVTFYTPTSPESLDSITFERGVEDFTLSCGTGALAAARVHLSGKDGRCAVAVPGGKLRVVFSGTNASLSGEARYIGWCHPTEGGKP